MRLKNLSELKRPEPYEIVVATLPQHVPMARYAMAKALKINELVRAVHGGSYEWYGFTIATTEDPELIVDVGLPKNDQNLLEYISIGPEKIAEYQESLPLDRVINGWVHSHGSLGYRQFSDVDERNQVTVLDYVTSLLKKPVAKREVVIRDLALLVKDRWTEKDLEQGSVALITDVPVAEARIVETVYGSFCYSIVIGDDGWHRQEIHYRKRGILSGQVSESKKEADLVLVDTGRGLTQSDIDALRDEVRTRIRPATSTPQERFEKEAT